MPLLITSAGLLVTFAAGLWNIGIEGQIIIGAVATTGVLRLLQDSTLPAGIIISLGILGGILGGALWASLAGALKTFGGVNEIFGGLGLNFIANTVVLWLIYGPWRRPGVASLSGTVAFPDRLSLPTLPGVQISVWSLLLGAVSIFVIYVLLRGTYIGLRLKAIGKNIHSSYILGIKTWQYLLLSFIVCGMFAGLTGALQVVAVYHRLLPSISSGYGFLGLLVAMLINFQAIWVAPIALFYAALNIGSVQLPITLKLDSNLSGVLQGILVLFVLLTEGIRQKFIRKALRGSNVMSFDLVIIGLAGVLVTAAPVIFAVIGETFAERSGVINLSVNGTIVLSAMTGFAVAVNTGSLILGYLAGMAVGGFIALIIAFSSITLHQSQVAVGFVLTYTTLSLAYFLGSAYTGVQGHHLPALRIPFLSTIPVLGPLLFRSDLLTYISYFLIVASLDLDI